MKIAAIIAQAILGLIFVVFGLNGFLGFIPVPPMPEMAGQFMGAFFGSGWGVVIKVLEIVFGAVMLASIFLNRFAPLAVVFLAPISVNIFLFHALLAPGNLVMGIVLLVLNAFLVYAYRKNFAGIFEPHQL